MSISNKVFNLSKTIIEQRIANRREVIIKTNNRDSGIYEVTINYYDSQGFIASVFITIFGEYYDLLMSQSPEFAPGKPENECRDEDIFYVLDKMESEQQIT